VLISLVISSAFAMNGECITPQKMRAFTEIPAVVPYPPPPADGEKAEREVDFPLENSLSSENFVVKWGNENLNQYDLDRLLDTFEVAWDSITTGMGYPAPVGSDTHLVNIYIGDSGDGSPDMLGAAGYQTLDSEGWPMIVISKGVLSGNGGDTSTAVHEFFHAVQHAVGNYGYWGEGAWFFEATACWIEPEVLVNDLTYMQFIFGYALIPQYSLHFFDYPDTGTLPEYHQYGAFLFPRYLSEHVADPQLIQDVWEYSLSQNDPLKALEAIWSDTDLSLEDVFIDFAAHNSVWDYSDGDHYELWVNYYATQMPEWDCSVSAEYWGGGTQGFVEANPDCIPQSFGYNVIELESPNSGDLVVSLDGDLAGDRLGIANWRAQLVLDRWGSYEYVNIPVEDGEGTLTICDFDADKVNLVVGAISGNSSIGEEFGYSYDLSVVTGAEGCDEPVDTGQNDTSNPGGSDPSGGCSCSVTKGNHRDNLVWLAGIISASLVIRRRR
jgi:hypothetical protein